MKTLFILVIAAVLCSGAPPCEARTLDEIMSQANTRATTLLKDHQSVGLAIAIIAPKSTRSVFVGKVAADDPRAPTADTLFEIASNTKVFTGILLADRVKNAGWSVDECAETRMRVWRRTPKWQDQCLTLRHLATHTNGLPDLFNPNLPYRHTPQNWLDPYADFTIEKLFYFLASAVLEQKPGSRWNYSNVGAGFLGNLLADSENLSYQDYLNKIVLQPLGMTRTFINVPDSLKPDLASGHDQTLQKTPYWDLGAIPGTGGLKSTLNDMSKLVEAQLQRSKTRVSGGFFDVIQESHQVLADDLCAKGSAARKYAYLLPVGVCGEFGNGLDSMYWHAGQSGGFRSFVAFDVSRNVGVVVLANLADTYPLDENRAPNEKITIFGLATMKDLIQITE